jgi:hypothetical protein
MTTFFSITAIFTRKLLNENDQFSFSINEFITSLKSNDIDENKELETKPASPDLKHFYRSTSNKVRNLISYFDTVIKNELFSPEIGKSLIIGLTFLIIFLIIVQIYLLGLLFPWMPHPSSVSILFSGVVVFLCIISIFLRKLLKSDQFFLSINEFINPTKSDSIDESEVLKKTSAPAEKRNFHKVESRKPKDLICHLYMMIKENLISPEIETGLVIGFMILILILSSIQIYLLSLFPWSLRPSSIVIFFLGITMFFSLIIIFTRELLKRHQLFFPVNESIRSLKLDDIDKNNTLREKPGFADKAKHLKSQILSGARTTSLPPDIEKGLIIGLIISIILVSGMQVYAKATQEKEAFTALYLLGPEGKAEGYPTESLLYVPINVTVGIENHELRDIVYFLQMKVDGEVIRELNVTLSNGETWQNNMTYTRQELKNGKSRLEFALFKQKPDYTPYRSVHLYIRNNNSIASIDPRKYAEVPPVENGAMEFSTGWWFTSNTSKITGSYVNNSGINSSAAYKIVNSNERNISNPIEYGEISQNVGCNGDTMVVLSAYLKSNSSISSQENVTQTEYITINGATVWTGEINGNEGWQHLIVPISLHAGSNNLALGLKQTHGKIIPLEILWDNVSFISLADHSESTTLEGNPPTSAVVSLPAFTSSNTFSVPWNGTDDISGIASYSVDSSTDGVNWEPWISRTTDTSSVFTGVPVWTFVFVSGPRCAGSSLFTLSTAFERK